MNKVYKVFYLYDSSYDLAKLLGTLTKSLFTNFTMLWPFPCMDPFMFSQGTAMRESLFTSITFMWFFTCVYPPMDN